MLLGIVLAVVLIPALLERSLRSPLYILHMAGVLSVFYLLQRTNAHYAFLNVRTDYLFLLYSIGLVHLVSINLVVFAAYAIDKRAARKKLWRIPERTLHALALVGGTPAALLASRILRHKNKKKSFRSKMWLICALQVTLLLYFFVRLYLG
jgi:uncharacterized membrane protein YsdA (DUF1294 family)